jgi:hydrogenase maturation protease
MHLLFHAFPEIEGGPVVRAKTLIVGIGNRLRGDDALGCLIAEKLAGTDDVTVIEHDGEPASLMDRWRGFERVVLVDAVTSGAEPGTIFELNLLHEKLASSTRNTSTHAFGVAEAVELSRALGTLPPRIVFYGIEADCFSTGGAMSPKICAAIEKIRNRIEVEIHA